MRAGLTTLPTPDSWIARRDPRWRLAALVLFAFVIVCLQTWQAAAVACALALVLAGMARLPSRWLLARLALVVPFVGLFALWLLILGPAPSWTWGPLRVSQPGLTAALLLCFKAAALLTVVLVGLATAPLPQTLAAAHALRLPGLLVQVTLLASRYVLLIVQEWRRVRIALRTRGYHSHTGLHGYRTLGHVAGTMLVRSYERAERVSHSMQCRGFDGRLRTLAVFGTSAADVVLFVAVTAGALGMGVWDWLLR